MDIVKSMNVESTMRSAFMFLMDLAWKSRLRIPFILTVWMMALDFRLQLDINISVTQRRRRRSRTRDPNNDDPNGDEGDIVVVQINQRYMRRAAQGAAQLPQPEDYDFDIGDDDTSDDDDSIMGGYLTDSDDSSDAAPNSHSLSGDLEEPSNDLEGGGVSTSSRAGPATTESVNSYSVCGSEVEGRLENMPIMRLLSCNCSDDEGNGVESDADE